MKSKFWMIVAVGIGIATISTPLLAHHGLAAYDTDKRVTVMGAVTGWLWSNPHCLIQVDATDDNGQVVHWGAETENPTTMTRQGWTKESMKRGDQVTVTILPVKNGKPNGRIVEVVLSNGQKLAGRVTPATEVKPEDSAR